MFQQAMNCPQCKAGTLKARKGKFGDFYGCSNYPNCKYTFTEKKGGFSEPPSETSPKPQNGASGTSEPVNPILLLTDEISALRGEFKDLDRFLRERLG